MYLILICSNLLTLCAFLNPYGWIFDLACHFRVQYAAVQLFHLPILYKRHRKIQLATTLLLLLVNLSAIAPLYLPPETAVANPTAEISLVHLNVNDRNPKLDILAYIEKKNPDFIVFQEFSPAWFKKVLILKRRYPYCEYFLSYDPYSIALFSKIPFDFAEVVPWGPAELPAIRADVTVRGKALTLFALHTLAPITPERLSKRNQELRLLAEARKEWHERAIIVGDLNTTSWSKVFADTLRQMNMYDSRRGFGIQRSWPASALFMPFWMTLDHVIVSPDMKVLARETGPSGGSDHSSVFVRLLF